MKFLQNGMTPLHLAVWHSLRAEDCRTVSTLLEYNADCNVKDNVSEALHFIIFSSIIICCLFYLKEWYNDNLCFF